MEQDQQTAAQPAITWEQLVAEHQAAVFRLAYLMLGNAQEAEDVAQDVFMRAFRAFDQFDTSRPARPWLLRIATNLITNRRRSFARAFTALTRMQREAPDHAPDVALASQAQLDAQELWHAIQQVQAADQEVLYLRYFLDLSEAEMAHTLNIASGTVKSRLHRALVRLRAIVEREFPALGERWNP